MSKQVALGLLLALSFAGLCAAVSPEEEGHSHDEPAAAGPSVFQKPVIWIASTVAILIISSVGLVGVAVVPLLQKVFFAQLIQYLVALAVGTLCGDAFLHLLPHALLSNTHSHEEVGSEFLNAEKVAVFKGLCALSGIYFFFLAEKVVSAFSEARAERKAEEEERKREAANPRRRSMDVRRLSAARPSATLGVPDSGPLRRPSLRLAVPLADQFPRRQSKRLSFADENIIATGLTSRAMKNIDNLYRYAEEQGDECEESETSIEEKPTDGGVEIVVPVVTPDKSKEKPKDLDTPADDKSAKKHGHSHEVPGSVAAVAWMVIMGDGLHNFTDGMAIGVAFTKSLTSGFSTTVAVFCHELPHELGDFAVLLKTGMKIKEAMFFNVVSSVLSFFGMLVGVCIGQIPSANSWVFTFTAGTFIYISLVDMLPELTGAELRQDESRLVQLVIQNVGLISGVGIMLLIALFEEHLLTIFN